MHDDSLKFVSYILIVNILMIVIESEKPCWEIAIKYVCMYMYLVCCVGRVEIQIEI